MGGVKLENINNDHWEDGTAKIRNPGKQLFVRILGATVREVNQQSNSEGFLVCSQSNVHKMHFSSY